MPEQQPASPMFSADSGSPRQGGFPAATVAIAGAVVLVIVGLLIALSGRHRTANPNQPEPLDPYAASLPLSGITMSESTSLSGGKSTFVDGTIRNTGSSTVTGVTVQVFFRNDEGMPPHVETLPLSLIRTREPYVDTQPVSTAPIAPGDTREFRLIFEAIPDNWNTQQPEIHVVHVGRR